MQRIGDWIIVVALVALAAYFFHSEPDHAPIALSSTPSLAVAELVPHFVKGIGVNYVRSSGEFSGPPWIPDKVSVLPNVSGAPDGSNGAFRLSELSGYGYHRVQAVIHSMIAGQVRTLSLYIKPAERKVLQFEMSDVGVGKYGTARFDLLKKEVVVENGDVIHAGIQQLPGGWFRCWAAMPFARESGGFNFGLVDSYGQIIYSGESKDGLLIWGAQLEPGSKPSGYSDVK